MGSPVDGVEWRRWGCAIDYACGVKLYNDFGAKASAPADWLVPHWPAPHNVRAVCTTRNGGVSLGPYQSMNLGVHVGDDPLHVQANRQRLRQALATCGGTDVAARPVFLDQIHGTDILTLNADTPDGMQADAAVTGLLHLACMVMVADCLPVLLCNSTGTRVAAAHAGWRGLAGQGGRGVLEAVAPALLDPEASTRAPHGATLAWLGPCIGPTAFEVGNDVRDAFVAVNAEAKHCFVPMGAGKWLANLSALARQRLQAIGIERVYGNDGSAPWCTVSNPSRFFSHRRDRVSGRMAASIWRTG
jgi:polyphenol oxidase